jgi:hypothetical protein
MTSGQSFPQVGLARCLQASGVASSPVLQAFSAPRPLCLRSHGYFHYTSCVPWRVRSATKVCAAMTRSSATRASMRARKTSELPSTTRSARSSPT